MSVRNVKMWSLVLLLLKKPICEECKIFFSRTKSVRRWLSIMQKNFPKQFETQIPL